VDSYCRSRQELHVVGRQMPPVHHSDRCAICEIECPPLYNPFLLASHQTKLNGQSSGTLRIIFLSSASLFVIYIRAQSSEKGKREIKQRRSLKYDLKTPDVLHFQT